jgi:hypothetical protein
MTKEQRVAIWSLAAIVVGIAAVLAAIFLRRPTEQLVLTGVVLRDDADPSKQQPITNVEISAADGLSVGTVKSDVAGLFRITLLPKVVLGQPITLQFRNPGYEPLDLNLKAGDQICVARMLPTNHEVRVRPNRPDIKISDVKVRYSTKALNTVAFANMIRMFQVSNVGNVPCTNPYPCSPDGKWRASIKTETMDGGAGNQLKNVRVSCVAGACPFTKIESETSSSEGREFKVTVRNWSDTATFMIEAEVIRTVVSDMVRQMSPATLGDSINFSTPPAAQGLSLQAEVDGSSIVFPLGPTLRLSWATCTLQVAPDRTKLYQCQLKPGYVLQQHDSAAGL